MKKEKEHKRSKLIKAYAKMNSVEESIKDCYKMDFSQVSDYCKVLAREKEPCDDFSRHLFQEYENNFVKGNGKFNNNFLEEYVENKLYNFYLDQTETDADVLLVIPEKRVIISIESKATTEDANFVSKLSYASGQLNKFGKFLKLCQSDVLTQDWKVMKGIAIPFIQNIDSEDIQKKLQGGP